MLQERSLFEQLDADRSLIPNFIEESLRHDAPVQRTTRRCTRDLEFAGVAMCPGDWVEMGIGSGNLDEAVFPEAEAFRLDRDDPRHHLGFGAGSHVCPGATLARLEGVTAVTVLLDRLAEMRPVEGVRYPPIPGSLGHQAIPAVLVPR
jgi:cytochrome P450